MSTPATIIPSSVPFMVLGTKEIDEIAQYLKHADIELIQTKKSQSSSKLTAISFDNIDLQVGEFGAACISNATIDKKRDGVIYKMNMDFPTVCNGYDIDSKDFMFYSKNSEHMAVNEGPCKWAYITFKSENLEHSLIDQSEMGLDTGWGKSSCIQSQKRIYLDSLYTVINEVTEFIQTNPEILKDRNILKGMELSLLDSQAFLLANTINTSNSFKNNTKKSHELIIKESIDFLKANSYEPIHVVELCNILNVKTRTLYYAFQEFYGIGPIRYLRLLRYAKARRDLLNSDPKRTSVTEIAAKWHFWHFGRFSVGYKNLYGESPSVTLNRTP